MEIKLTSVKVSENVAGRKSRAFLKERRRQLWNRNGLNKERERRTCLECNFARNIDVEEMDFSVNRDKIACSGNIMTAFSNASELEAVYLRLTNLWGCIPLRCCIACRPRRLFRVWSLEKIDDNEIQGEIKESGLAMPTSNKPAISLPCYIREHANGSAWTV